MFMVKSALRDMDITARIQGSHATASPSGQYVASVVDRKLRIRASSSPERFTHLDVRIQPKDIATLRWNDDSSYLSVSSAQHIKVVSLDDATHHVRLENGSGGLGRFVSADFVGLDQLLVIWEFGGAKLWNLSNGKALELVDAKLACGGDRWQLRPSGGNPTLSTLAVLSRPGADDILNLYLPALQSQVAAVRLPTSDAQSVSWSPDGRWLAVLDTPTATQSVHFYTPDGHHFRSYPPAGESSTSGLGVRSTSWCGSSRLLALAKHDGRVVLLNTRTFTPLAMIEHTTRIDQRAIPLEQQAPVWQETASMTGERFYTTLAQPVSPPLSRSKPSTEPGELGVAEAHFSCDGSFLSTRDERMLNTVWIWNMTTLAAHAVLIQHSNVRRLHWHPTRPESLMIDCGEAIAYMFDASSGNSPVPLSIPIPGTATLSWIHTPADTNSILLAATKSSFCLVYPEGRPESSVAAQDGAHGNDSTEVQVEEDAFEDSIFDVLSGRKPMPAKTEQSYTERVDLEVETEDEDLSTRMDDTFREQKSRKPVSLDPLDDSQIF